ncbi:hypothetical protein JKP88DRAFT_174057 [Tribonema minus]|uniref:SGNH hydrolase-type esterase domain-containing protein n=1 Tax=Tribonema minus TaxID=303371 RepID=A0A835ZGF8_9STRA|nr:hypothetical protein JKP88DRAFT_174057 [Tribonema minus]
MPLPFLLKPPDITEQQLEVLFEKCVTPGASIVVASTGGSITAGGGAHVGDANVYIHRLARHVAQLCPQAAVTTINAARGGTGSLTTGMCLTNLLGPRVDLLAVEFSLNDFEQYTVGGAFSAAPYELLLRAALTAYQHAPAVYSVYFWGQMFRHESAQEPHLAVARAYGVTGVSMRDVVWSALDARAAPYATKEAILADPKHHPNARVHNHLGDILALHLAQKLVRWADADGGALAGERRGAHRLLPFAPLRTPLAPELAAYDVAAHAFRCEIAGTPREGPAPALYEAAGWERFAMGARTDVRLDSQECVQATRTAAEGASLIIDGESAPARCAVLLVVGGESAPPCVLCAPPLPLLLRFALCEGRCSRRVSTPRRRHVCRWRCSVPYVRDGTAGRSRRAAAALRSSRPRTRVQRGSAQAHTVLRADCRRTHARRSQATIVHEGLCTYRVA